MSPAILYQLTFPVKPTPHAAKIPAHDTKISPDQAKISPDHAKISTDYAKISPDHAMISPDYAKKRSNHAKISPQKPTNTTIPAPIQHLQTQKKPANTGNLRQIVLFLSPKVTKIIAQGETLGNVHQIHTVPERDEHLCCCSPTGSRFVVGMYS